MIANMASANAADDGHTQRELGGERRTAILGARSIIGDRRVGSAGPGAGRGCCSGLRPPVV